MTAPIINAQIMQGMLYDASLGEPRQEYFDPMYWQARQLATSTQGGRGNVLFIDDAERHWVLRHYRRGGLIGKLIHDQYFFLGAEATRAFREWRLLARLYAQALPVPRPVAARYRRSGLSYRADLLTTTIPNALTLTQRLSKAALPAEIWQDIGRTLARFHAVGVHHADLNAHNIVFDAHDKVWVLDFDRGQLRAVQSQWITAVLERLLRSLNKLRERRGIHFKMEDWPLLLQAHDQQLAQLRGGVDA